MRTACENRPSSSHSGVILNEFLCRFEHLLGSSDRLLCDTRRYTLNAFCN